MKYNKRFTLLIFVVSFWFIVFSFLYIVYHEAQWRKVYQKINEWEVSRNIVESIWDDSLSIMWSDAEMEFYEAVICFHGITVYIEQWDGNVYIVKDSGDTIWKHITKEKE